MSRRSVLTAVVLVAAVLGAAPAIHAQSADQQAKNASDMKALAAYRLTMPTVHKLGAAYENMVALAADSVLARHVQRDQEGHPDQSASSIEDMAAFFDRYPQLRSAITRSGLTPREFAIANLSLMQATMVVGYSDLAKAKKQLFDEAASGAPAANLAFVRANKAELDRVMAKLDKWQKAQANSIPAKRADDGDDLSEDGDDDGDEPPR